MNITEIFGEMKKMNLNGKIYLEENKIIWEQNDKIVVEIDKNNCLEYITHITTYYIENGLKQTIDIRHELGTQDLYQHIKEENDTIYVKEIKKNRILWFFKDEYEKMKEKKKAKYIVIE